MLSSKLQDRLEYFKQLEDGWNDGSGVKIESKYISIMERILPELCQRFGEPDEFFPTPDGGIDLKWSLKHKSIYITIETGDLFISGSSILIHLALKEDAGVENIEEFILNKIINSCL